MVEVAYFAGRSNLTVEEALIKMREAGVDSMPGGGAEIFSPECAPSSAAQDRRRRVAQYGADRHKLGFKSNATMLYGHIETNEERVDHLLSCAPCRMRRAAFKLYRAGFSSREYGVCSSVADDRADGYSPDCGQRLLLDNFQHIKAYWQMLGPKLRKSRCASEQ